jgi:hypothetical protein
LDRRSLACSSVRVRRYGGEADVAAHDVAVWRVSAFAKHLYFTEPFSK